MEQNTPHRRRPRYSGKYPKNFREKYKELDPEKYGDIAAHVTAKGSTPAGTHIPIMVSEILDVLKIQPGESGMDATLGYGGHTLEFLKALDHSGHLWSTDIDPIESLKTENRLRALGYDEGCWTVVRTNFKNVDQVAADAGGFDFLLADLGVSSMQIDDPSRGFSWKTEGPLDLRMDPEHGTSAAERLKELEEDELEGLFAENADEPKSSALARAIRSAIRSGKAPETTTDLRNIVYTVYGLKEEAPGRWVPAKGGAAGTAAGKMSGKADARTGGKAPGSADARAAGKGPGVGNAEDPLAAAKKACARVFQALRIDVNREFEVLYEFLGKLPDAMKPGGRIAILTFHSGEDRLVKKAFKAGYQAGLYAEIADDVIRPSAEECVRNPRARSTKLRWAVRA